LAQYLLKRVGLALLTLVLLSLLIFFAGQILPGDPGRAILGPFAAQSAVKALDKSLGLDRPLLTQYWSWATGIAHGNLGMSYQFRAPVTSFLGPALLLSLKLAAVAFVLVVPISIVGGVVAAMNRGRPVDRIISVTGLSLSTVPEFVTGIVLIVVFAIGLKVLPVTASAPPGASPLTVLKYLILPAIPLVLVLFGYIARMARAGTVEALDSDYVRTATLKGLPRSVVVRRHVLRNSLLPTITVIATQTGYLIGGLVVVERLFNYPGLGRLIFTAATDKDFPMLEAGVLVIGIVYLAATLIADVLYTVLNPRIRLQRAELWQAKNLSTELPPRPRQLRLSTRQRFTTRQPSACLGRLLVPRQARSTIPLPPSAGSACASSSDRPPFSLAR
jgi:peptide/nickel transport system permease protein